MSDNNRPECETCPHRNEFEECCRVDAPRCPSCGVTWREHLGPTAQCAKLRETEAALRELLETTCTTLEHVPAKYKTLAKWVRENMK